MQTVFSYLSFFIFLSQNFFPEQMVAWCQEINGSIPQSQLLQVRKRRKWICDTAKSGLAHIMNLCVTLLLLNEHFSGFKQLLKCILMSCDSKEAALLKHERHSGLKNSFSRWSSAFFPPPVQNFLNSSSCPEIQGFLYMKETGRKSWKKLYMFLRRSGLYCSTKGMSKASFSLIEY